ncbi:AAA family ATPase [Metamycoplasma hyosynoviae]|uniref:ATP-dependent DNA helicase n=1 Tax=Metamycoplasma hyosynoviae TaxID=29559 RepID=UPI002366D985|nr:AAA family ATPase [Metamycoplasma hyosynoviae]MDD7837538.1 AAA family ATPase [Metamycoplasma hyosynoviae]
MSDYVKITGMFKKMLFEKEVDKFRIASCKIIQVEDKNISVKTNKYGNISVISKDFDFEFDKYYELTLENARHSKYPESYNLIELKESELWKLNYVVKFLQGTNFPGIGEIRAKKIVEKYGFNTLKVIAYDKSITAKSLGINDESLEKARHFLKTNPQIIEDQLFFLKLNLSPSFYEKISKEFSNLSQFLETYRENFYKYYFESDGVIISDLEKISKNFYPEGHFFDYSIRIYKALEDFFFNLGHTKTQINTFYSYYYLNYEKITIEVFKEGLKHLIQENYILLFDNRSWITTAKLRNMEEYIIKRLKSIKYKNNAFKFKKFNSPDFHKLQNEAINTSLNNSLTLITGSPGTGKTLIINKIIKLLLEHYDNNNIAVVTPTGRATININKNSEIKASTIHSFLQWNVEENVFEINETWPEKKEVLIIDEFSMVSVDLFYHLLKGISEKTLTKIILVGDKNQLPAIGPGYLIKDFIETGIFETIELIKIYRQSENYEIIKDAIDINEMKIPEFKGKNSKFNETSKENLGKAVISEIKKLLKKGFTKRDIGVLSPIYNYQTGIDNLNVILSEFWRNQEKTESITLNKRTLFIDDKIINLINDPIKNIFNGEIGYINKFIYNENILTHIQVEFEYDHKYVQYTKKDFLQKTTLAYCTSVHKYQGSECPIVLTILFDEAKKLLSKKLLYTAITRAQRLSVIFGEYEALQLCIENDEDSNRQTCIEELWKTIEGAN